MAAGTIFFAYIGIDAISTAGDEVKDPQHTMPRAIIYALLIVTGVHVLVAFAAMGSQPWQDFQGEEAVLAVILDRITGNTAGSTLVCAGVPSVGVAVPMRHNFPGQTAFFGARQVSRTIRIGLAA